MACGEPLADKAAVPKVVTPELFKVPEPIVLVPSRNDTVPVGMPPLPVTVAVNVTTVPASAGLDELIIVVELVVKGRLVMTCETTLEVLPVKELLPL